MQPFYKANSDPYIEVALDFEIIVLSKRVSLASAQENRQENCKLFISFKTYMNRYKNVYKLITPLQMTYVSVLGFSCSNLAFTDGLMD